MSSNYKLLVFTLSMVLCFPMHADETCSNAFSNAVQTHSNNPANNIYFGCGSKVLSWSNKLNTITLDKASGLCGTTCFLQNCQATGLPSSSIDVGDFVESDGNLGDVIVSESSEYFLAPASLTANYNNIIVNQDATIVFENIGGGTTYLIQNLIYGDNSEILLQSGDYWIENIEAESSNDNVEINIDGDGIVRLFVRNDIVFNDATRINRWHSSSQLFIYTYGDLNIGNSSNITAYIYSEQNVDVGSSAFLYGTINAVDVNLGAGSRLWYDRNPNGLEFGEFCVNNEIPTHFVIEHDQEGVYCIEEQIKITALNSDGITEDYNGSINLDIGNNVGTWRVIEGNGSIVNNIYYYDPSDDGIITLGLTYTAGGNLLNINVSDTTDNTVTDDNSEGLIFFDIAGYLLSANNMSAGESQIINLSAYGVIDGSCGVITSYSGSMNLSFWSEYVDPINGHTQFSVNGSYVARDEASSQGQIYRFYKRTSKCKY